MRIGIDFDNTIITYDEVFRAAARAQGLIEPGFDGSKQAVRDAIRLLPDGELTWQKLQGQVYGKGIVACRPLQRRRQLPAPVPRGRSGRFHRQPQDRVRPLRPRARQSADGRARLDDRARLFPPGRLRARAG